MPEAAGLARPGAPAPSAAADTFPINGTDYVEFYVGNAKQASVYYRAAFGYRLTAYRGPETGVRDRASYVLEQDKVRLILTTALRPDHAVAEHVHNHGDGVKDIALCFMKGICTANRGHMIHDLEKRGAKLFNCTRLKAIHPGEVTIARNISSTVPDPYVTWTPLLPENIPNPLAKAICEEIVEQILKADLVVMAVGLQADHSLFEACQAQNTAGDIFFIGDNFRIGHVLEAVKAGFNIGSSL